MHKKEFIKYIAEKNDIKQTEASKAINLFLEGVMSALEEGKDINLVGFGSFTTYERGEYPGRNVRTGEVITVPASKKPRFKPGKKFKDVVNK
jgi:DNA-binding protein HU-beta